VHIALSFAPAHRKHLVHRTELGPCTSHSSLHIALVKEFRASSGCDLCLASTHNIWQQVADRQPPPARLPLLFPPALQAPAVTPALVGDAAAAAAAAPAAAAVAAPAQTADVTAPVVAAGGVKRKNVADAASALEDLLENAAQGRKLVAAKKSGKDAKAKAKAKAKATKEKGEVKAPAATAKGKGEGSPAIIVENSRNQIKAWTGRKGDNMNRIVSFKSITHMNPRKIAVDWLVARCKELKIAVPAQVK
jgi:hypothetical protein